MTISERVAYVKGLAEGMKLDGDTNEGKILYAMIEILEDISDEIDSIEDMQYDLEEQLDEVDEDLSAVEDFVYGDDDEFEDECDGCCGCDGDLDDDEVYEVTCPNCNDTIYLDEEMLEEEGITCPNCGTELEFDFDGDCEDCTDCGCDK